MNMNTIFKKKVVVKVDNTVDIKVFKYIQYLSDIFLNDIYFITFLRGQLNVYVKKPKLFFLLSFFKNHSNTQFKLLNDIFAIDYIKYNKFFRFELVYSLLSVLFNTRLFIKVHTDEFTAIQSVTQLFAGANWFERETWDMYGIYFCNHDDLRRILTDYGFQGFPLRKDFPLTGFYELRYNDQKAALVYEDLTLTQEYRTYHFLSPWNI